MAYQDRDKACTLQVVADTLGVEREQIRRIERSALLKCLSYCIRNQLLLVDLVGREITPDPVPLIYFEHNVEE